MTPTSLFQHQPHCERGTLRLFVAKQPSRASALWSARMPSNCRAFRHRATLEQLPVVSEIFPPCQSKEREPSVCRNSRRCAEENFDVGDPRRFISQMCSILDRNALLLGSPQFFATLASWHKAGSKSDSPRRPEPAQLLNRPGQTVIRPIRTSGRLCQPLSLKPYHPGPDRHAEERGDRHANSYTPIRLDSGRSL